MKRLLLAALVSCGGYDPDDLTFRDPTDFPASEQDELRMAMDEWNARTVDDAQLSWRADGVWSFVREQPTWYSGLTVPAHHLVHIDPSHTGTTVHEIALHELGHVLHLGHTTTGVMANGLISTEFTPEVMAECRRVGACP